MSESRNIEILDTPNEEAHLKITSYALKYGMIAGLIGIIYMLFLYVIDQEYNKELGYLANIIPIAIMIFAIVNYKKENQRRLIGKRGFRLGLLTFLVYGIIIGLWIVLYTSLINPDYFEGLKEFTINDLENRGLSDSLIEQQVKIMSFMFSPIFMMIMSILGSVFIGLIAAGVTAPILKTQSNETKYI